MEHPAHTDPAQFRNILASPLPPGKPTMLHTCLAGFDPTDPVAPYRLFANTFRTYAAALLDLAPAALPEYTLHSLPAPVAADLIDALPNSPAARAITEDTPPELLRLNTTATLAAVHAQGTDPRVANGIHAAFSATTNTPLGILWTCLARHTTIFTLQHRQLLLLTLATEDHPQLQLELTTWQDRIPMPKLRGHPDPRRLSPVHVAAPDGTPVTFLAFRTPSADHSRRSATRLNHIARRMLRLPDRAFSAARPASAAIR